MQDGLLIFREHFSRWVKAYNGAPTNLNKANNDHALRMLEDRIDRACLMQVGAALHDGWIAAEKGEHREYFLCASDCRSPGNLPSLYHSGNGVVIPWWELYVQLADYARLRALGEILDVEVRLEDKLMDIAVWDRQELLLYVENKEKTTEAKNLVRGMQKHGDEGFELGESSGAKDPLKKARYLFRTDGSPRFFAASTLDYQAVYTVEYLGGNHRFRLTEIPGGITAPLVAPDFLAGRVLKWPIQKLAVEIERQAQILNLADRRRFWFSPGTKQTAFNLYVYSPSSGKYGLALGAYQSGKIWSELKSLSPETIDGLLTNLNRLGISFNRGEEAFWRTEKGQFVLQPEDCPVLATAFLESFFPGHFPS